MSLPQQLRGVATSFHIMNECQLFGRLLCPRIFHQKGIFVVKFQPLRNRHSHGKDFAQWKFTLQRSLLLIQSILYYQNSTFIWKYLISVCLTSGMHCTKVPSIINTLICPIRHWGHMQCPQHVFTTQLLDSVLSTKTLMQGGQTKFYSGNWSILYAVCDISFYSWYGISQTAYNILQFPVYNPVGPLCIISPVAGSYYKTWHYLKIASCSVIVML